MTILAKSLQTIKDALNISGLLWKGKIWATYPTSLKACRIALSTFPSPLEKLCLFVAISLCVKSLFHSWQEEFYSTRLLQTEFFLKRIFYYISFWSFSHFSCHQQQPCFNNQMLFTLQNKNVSRSTKLCPECYRLTLSQSLLGSATTQYIIPSQHFRF